MVAALWHRRHQNLARSIIERDREGHPDPIARVAPADLGVTSCAAICREWHRQDDMAGAGEDDVDVSGAHSNAFAEARRALAALSKYEFAHPSPRRMMSWSDSPGWPAFRRRRNSNQVSGRVCVRQNKSTRALVI